MYIYNYCLKKGSLSLKLFDIHFNSILYAVPEFQFSHLTNFFSERKTCCFGKILWQSLYLLLKRCYVNQKKILMILFYYTFYFYLYLCFQSNLGFFKKFSHVRKI